MGRDSRLNEAQGAPPKPAPTELVVIVKHDLAKKHTSVKYTADPRTAATILTAALQALLAKLENPSAEPKPKPGPALVAPSARELAIVDRTRNRGGRNGGGNA